MQGRFMDDILTRATARTIAIADDPAVADAPLSLAPNTCLYCGTAAPSGRCPEHRAYTAGQVANEVMRRLKGDAAYNYALQQKAARIAADKGDSRPAEWALERAIPELAKKPDVAPVGLQVVVGINLPGLPGYGENS